MATKVLAASGGDYTAWSTYISYLVGLGTFTATETGNVRDEFDGGNCNLSGIAPTSSFRLIIQGETQFSGSPLRYTDGGRVLFNASSEEIRIDTGVNYVTIQNLAVKKTAVYGNILITIGSRAGLILQNLVLQDEHSGAFGGLSISSDGGATLDNILHIRTAGSSHGITSTNGNHTFKNCGTIALAGSAGTGFRRDTYGSPIAINCYAYGYATDWSATGWNTTDSKNNATDKASGSSNVPGSGTAQFEITSSEWASLTGGSHDLRVASGSTKLKNNGAASGGTTTDIIGQSISGGTRDIGPFELQEASGLAANPILGGGAAALPLGGYVT